MKFDVIVSFRATDTRRTFVSHLLLSLSKAGIRTFKREDKEDELLEKQPASSRVLQAIKESKIAIVVVSKAYTTSRSCRDELVTIMECEEKQSLTVIPVFYQVDPLEVLRLADKFLLDNKKKSEKVKSWGRALQKSVQIYVNSFCWDIEELESYTIERVMVSVSHCLTGSEALCEEPSPNGYGILDTSDTYLWPEGEADYDLLSTGWGGPSTPRRSDIVETPKTLGLVTMGIGFVRAAFEAVAERFMIGEKRIDVEPRPAGSFVDVHREEDNYDIGNELSRILLPNDCSSLVGMDRHTKAVHTLLDLHLKDRVGEIGIWGVRGVGKTTLAKYVYEQISPHFQDHYFMEDAKNYSVGRHSTCLLEEITSAALMPTSESESLHEVVKAKLGHRKVLLIVDDLFHIDQLENIRKFSRWFGAGSRLILVSENSDLLLQCEIKRLYEVESLRYDEALQLFSQFAFKQKHVPRGFEQLSVRAVLITGRIPLALKIFGSFLCGKCNSEWLTELWRLEALQNHCVGEVSSYIKDAFS